MKSAALVGTDGSIDWCCFPRFDSPSVFAAILDDERGGRFQVAPASPYSLARQSYVPDTNILETRFSTSTGELSVTDFMPVEEMQDSPRTGSHEIHRIIRCTYGWVEVECTFSPRLDYARATTVIRPSKEGVSARGGHQTLTLLSHRSFLIDGSDASSRFTLHEGQETALVLAYGRARPQRLRSYRTRDKLERTRAYWQAMASSLSYEGCWRDEVVRSLPSAAPHDLPADRRHSRRAHLLAPREHRRVAQLGLPFLVAQGLQLHDGGPVPHGAHRRGRSLPRVARRSVQGHERQVEDRLRHIVQLVPEGDGSRALRGLFGCRARADRQRRGAPLPARRLRRGHPGDRHPVSQWRGGVGPRLGPDPEASPRSSSTTGSGRTGACGRSGAGSSTSSTPR